METQSHFDRVLKLLEDARSHRAALPTGPKYINGKLLPLPVRQPNLKTFYIGSDAKQKLIAMAPSRMFLSSYIDFLVSDNPNPEGWQDTRPDELRAADADRQKNNLLPLWSYGESDGSQPEGTLRLSLKPATIEHLAAISLFYGIGRSLYVAHEIGRAHTYYEAIRTLRPTTLVRQTAVCRAGYTLTAFAYGYLCPLNIQHYTHQQLSPHREVIAQGRHGRKKGSKNPKHL